MSVLCVDMLLLRPAVASSQHVHCQQQQRGEVGRHRANQPALCGLFTSHQQRICMRRQSSWLWQTACMHACIAHKGSALLSCYMLQDKDGPKALDEFCRDLCEEVRMNKIDPVSIDPRTQRVCVETGCPWVAVGISARVCLAAIAVGQCRVGPVCEIHFVSLWMVLCCCLMPNLVTSLQVIGREREVARVIQILGRRTKNNPILLGEPGMFSILCWVVRSFAVVFEPSSAPALGSDTCHHRHMYGLF